MPNRLEDQRLSTRLSRIWYNAVDGRTEGRSACRAHSLAPRRRPRCAEGSLSTAAVQSHRRIWSAAAFAICCSAAGPKDFDIGTSAHPYQVKKLFRNCWIIGRRFRLAHVKFGTKVIEVATFRRQVAPGEEIVQDGVPAPAITAPEPAEASLADPADAGSAIAAVASRRGETADHLIHHDNTFGTPEEDAFRRDFTINALFYDIATFSIIDYVGGLEDLRAGLVRSIGDPEVRFREDPVRMMRAVALAARLDFTIDQPSLDAIHDPSTRNRAQLPAAAARGVLQDSPRRIGGDGRSASWRSSGCSNRFRRSCITAPPRRSGNRSGRSTAYRRRFESMPDTLTNAILLGSLIGPLGLVGPRAHDGRSSSEGASPNEGVPGTASNRGESAGPTPARRPPPRRAAAGTPRRRTSEADSRSPAAASRSHRQPARQKGAHPPQHLSRSADLAGYSRRGARCRRAMESASRRHATSRRKSSAKRVHPRRSCRAGGGGEDAGATAPIARFNVIPLKAEIAPAVLRRFGRPAPRRSSCTAWPA